MAHRFLVISIFAICLKLLFIPMYHSTDMEVHRNWMAITHNKPISEWYYEETSIWTLDYPPLFAWLEYLLSFPAKYFDSDMLNIQKESYMSANTLLFMRFSVIITDILFMLAVKRASDAFWKRSPLDDKHTDPWLRVEVIFSMLMLLNPGLLIVDHIHFQYNGFLFGLLLLSLAALKEEKYVECAFWYTLLINFKHLYICLAPAYFVYLLKNYCFANQRSGGVSYQSFSVKNFLKLSVTVGAITFVSFGPFIYMGQLNQVMQRIFPVKRGLTHEYWAPNIWALYNAVDITLSFLVQKAGFKTFSTSPTRGLVQEYSHKVLPSINIKIAILFALLSVLPFMWQIWKKPKNIQLFIHCIIGCAFGSFLFGYHVHEKAVLTIILPFTILAVSNPNYVTNYIFLSCAGHLALFPLLYQSAESPVKTVILILHVAYVITALQKLHRKNDSDSVSWMLVLKGFLIPVLYAICSLGLCVSGLNTRFPFLPLMIVSCHCAIFILYSWISFLNRVFVTDAKFRKKVK